METDLTHDQLVEKFMELFPDDILDTEWTDEQLLLKIQEAGKNEDDELDELGTEEDDKDESQGILDLIPEEPKSEEKKKEKRKKAEEKKNESKKESDEDLPPQIRILDADKKRVFRSLMKEPTITTQFQLLQDENAQHAYYSVTINGLRTIVPRGRTITIPKSIHDMIIARLEGANKLLNHPKNLANIQNPDGRFMFG